MISKRLGKLVLGTAIMAISATALAHGGNNENGEYGPRMGYGSMMGDDGPMMGGYGSMMGGYGPMMGGYGSMMGGYGPMMGGYGPMMGGYGMGMPERQLTDQQRDRLRDIHKQLMEQQQPLMQQMLTRCQELQSLYLAPTLEPKAISDKYGQIFSLRQQMILHALQAQKDMQELLRQDDQ